jgi:PAS domain S-box-containing protein
MPPSSILIPALAAAIGSTFAIADGGARALWWITEIGTGALVVTAATLFWTLRLQRLVHERTAELEAKNRELERESGDRRDALEAYRELFENANDIVYTHDLAGTFTSINKAAERVLGYTHEDVLTLTVRDVVAPEDAAIAQQMIAKKVGGDASRTEYELAVRTKSGRRVTLEVNTRLIRRDGVIVGVQGIARDVTERKRLEWQLGQSQKMEAVGQLAGGIAHDFNNLLTAILGNTQLAQLGETMTPELSECLHEIATASHRAAALTRQLLVFSRQEQIDRRPVSLATTLGDFMKMLRRIIGEHIDVRLAIAADVPPVLADLAQVEQVVLNLAVNARDAMPDGGRLVIEVDQVTLTDPVGTSTSRVPAGRYARLRVTDTGCGIRADVRERIFEPFFTTKPVGAGTGLGLAVVYGIVRQHDGFIDVASEPGEGTRFTVYLPAIDREVLRPSDPPRTAVTAGRETILVAEDEAALRRLTERLLTGLGYTVLVAEDGVEALELFERRRDEIDLLLLDVVMPRAGGSDVHARVRAAGSAVPVVFMTGYSAEVAPHTLGAETGSRVLYKPYDVDALSAAIRDALQEVAPV